MTKTTSNPGKADRDKGWGGLEVIAFNGKKTNYPTLLRVRVIGAADETLDLQFLGKVGLVTRFNFNHEYGNIGDAEHPNTSDPTISVLFQDGTSDFCWAEELSILGVQSDE